MAYTIVLDAGHGGADPGAVFGGRKEKDDTLALTLAVGRLLERGGVNVVYTRTTDLYQTPFEKAQTGNRSGADYFISIHRNSSEQAGEYSGVETLVYDKSGVKLAMAENINGALEELGFRNLGVKARPGLVVLRRTQMPALLIEAGFVNTDSDNALFDEKREQIALAIANAILGSLDLETVTDGGTAAPLASMDANAARVDAAPRDFRMRPEQPGVWHHGRHSAPAQPELLCGSPAPVPGGGPADGDGVSGGNAPGEGAADPPETLYRVQVGLYKIRQNADNMLFELLDQGYPAFILNEDGYYKVQVGAYRQLGNAIIMERRLRRNGYSTLITT